MAASKYWKESWENQKKKKENQAKSGGKGGNRHGKNMGSLSLRTGRAGYAPGARLPLLRKVQPLGGGIVMRGTAGGTGDAGFVLKSGKVGCVSHLY